jgi:hypothetical protein
MGINFCLSISKNIMAGISLYLSISKNIMAGISFRLSISKNFRAGKSFYLSISKNFKAGISCTMSICKKIKAGHNFIVEQQPTVMHGFTNASKGKTTYCLERPISTGKFILQGNHPPPG